MSGLDPLWLVLIVGMFIVTMATSLARGMDGQHKEQVRFLQEITAQLQRQNELLEEARGPVTEKADSHDDTRLISLLESIKLKMPSPHSSFSVEVTNDLSDNIHDLSAIRQSLASIDSYVWEFYKKHFPADCD